MTLPKRKVSVSLDEDLVRELESGGETLSAQINDAIHGDLERRRRHRLLGELIEELERAHGPIPDDELQKYLDLLG